MDFVLMVTAKEIAAFGLVVIGILALMIALWIAAEWVMEMIEAYSADAEHWHITEDRHHDIH